MDISSKTEFYILKFLFVSTWIKFGGKWTFLVYAIFDIIIYKPLFFSFIWQRRKKTNYTVNCSEYSIDSLTRKKLWVSLFFRFFYRNSGFSHE